MKKKGRPSYRELVVCKITTINPNSAYAKLVEYENLSGMIHVSEVANRWVRNIREFLKENQYLVCTIMRIDDNYISLSAKRVSKEQSTRKMNDFKRELKASKLLEMLSKTNNIDSKEIDDNISYPLQENFGSIWKAFDIALKNEELFRKRSEIEKKWADMVIELVKKSYSEREYTIKSEMTLSSFSPDGVELIKKALLKSIKSGFDVRYISAPKYMLSLIGKDIKEMQTTVENESQRIAKEIEKSGGIASYKIENKTKK